MREQGFTRISVGEMMMEFRLRMLHSHNRIGLKLHLGLNFRIKELNPLRNLLGNWLTIQNYCRIICFNSNRKPKRVSKVWRLNCNKW